MSVLNDEQKKKLLLKWTSTLSVNY